MVSWVCSSSEKDPVFNMDASFPSVAVGTRRTKNPCRRQRSKKEPKDNEPNGDRGRPGQREDFKTNRDSSPKLLFSFNSYCLGGRDSTSTNLKHLE